MRPAHLAGIARKASARRVKTDKEARSHRASKAKAKGSAHSAVKVVAAKGRRLANSKGQRLSLLKMGAAPGCSIAVVSR